MNRVCLTQEIARLKSELQKTAKSQHYDLNHPDVISISKNLDKLILQLMQKSDQQ